MNFISALSFLAHKYSKIPYYFHKVSGLFSQFSPLSDLFGDATTITIVSKGASLAEISNRKLEVALDSADVRVLVSSVDIEHHPVLSQKRFDVQVVGRIDNLKGYVPVYSDRILKSFGINALCVNTSCNYMSGLSIYRFHKFYSKK